MFVCHFCKFLCDYGRNSSYMYILYNKSKFITPKCVLSTVHRDERRDAEKVYAGVEGRPLQGLCPPPRDTSEVAWH